MPRCSLSKRCVPLAVCLLAAVGGAGAGADPEASLDDLAWMAGHWIAESDGTTQEEVWMAPAGGIMPGLHRDTFANGRSFFEFLRVAQSDDGIVYYASPGGGATTAFRLIDIGKQRAIFENPEHDFPQRILYRLEGGRLCARIEGEKDGETRGREWCWERRP